MFECEACEDNRFVATATREIAPGVSILDRPVPCPKCVPLATRADLAGIPTLYREATIAGALVRPGNEGAIAAAKAWGGDTSVVFASREDHGDSAFGTGKTHIACAMLVEQIDKGRPARFLSEQDYLEHMKSLFDGEGEGAQAYAERVAAEPLLCIDDLGKAQDTAWAQSQMFRLLDARYRSKRPTLITTNASYNQIVARLGGALVDRLNDAQWVFVGGTSMRGGSAT